MRGGIGHHALYNFTQERTAVMNCPPWVYAAFLVALLNGSRDVDADPNTEALLKAVTFYASFDERVAGDYGSGELLPRTRSDHSTEKGKFVVERGFRESSLRIAKNNGVHRGALEGFDVLPRRGRMFFPAKGNLPYDSDGWSGAVSVWLNTDPNTMLKTSYCDPVQITERRAGDGGLWIDFPNTKPRDMRLGVFRALAVGEKAVPESDPAAPLVQLADVGFQNGDWHHVVMNWRNLDSGKTNASAELFIDGKLIGRLTDREIAMEWNLDKTGIYVAVNYIGLLDELAIFDKPLEKSEILYLKDTPGAISVLKNAP